MRTLPAKAEPLVESRVLADVPLLTVTVVTDHTAPTFDTPLTATTKSTQLVLGSDPEIPYLQRITFPIETMPHLPGPNTGGVDTLLRVIRFNLTNAYYQGKRLYDYLTQTGRLDRAKLSLSTWMCPPREMAGDFIDGRTSDGALISYFDGVIDRVISVGDEIQCIGKSELPEIEWLTVPDDAADPRDRGVQLPLPVGKRALVRCVNLDLGAAASTGARVAIGDDQIVLGIEEAGTFPTSGTALLGAEKVSWTGRTGNTLTGVTRGESGTTEADHVPGSQIFEEAPFVVTPAGYTITSVQEVYALSLTTGQTIELNPLLFSVDYADETTPPAASGTPITSISFTSDQMASIVNSLVADAAVTQQGIYGTATNPTEGVQIESPLDTDNDTVPATSGAEGLWTATTTAPTWTYSKGSATYENLQASFPNGLLLQAGLKGLRFARFGFDVTCNTLTQTTIAVGLVVSGVEAALVGLPDGSVVASVELTSTGAITNIWGAYYQAQGGANVEDLNDVLIDVAKGEVTGGNPTVAFTIDAIRIEYGYVNDLIADTQIINVASEGTTNAAGAGFWNGDWSGLLGPSPDIQRDDGNPSRQHAWFSFADPFVGDPVYEGATITGMRLRYHVSRSGSTSNSFTGRWYDHSQTGGWLSVVPADVNLTIPGGGVSFEETEVTNALTFTPGITGGDVAELFVKVAPRDGTNTNTAEFEMDLEVDFLIKDPGLAPAPRLADTQIQSAAGGFSFEFFAVVDGPEIPGTGYSAAAGSLMTHPSDVVQWWLREIGGYAESDIDNGAPGYAGSSSFETAVTNLVGYEWGVDLRSVGGDWRSVLARMGYESRANLCRPSNGPWKMLTATAGHSWVAGGAVATILESDVDGLILIGKDDSEIWTRLQVYFGYDPRAPVADNRSFFEVQSTDPTAPAVVTRESEFGRSDRPPDFLLCHTAASASGVTDWREYMEQELGRFGRIASFNVKHWAGYALELGDIVSLVLETETLTCRVIETQRDQVNGNQMRLVEVT